MANRDGMIIRAFDPEGRIVLHQSFSSYSWYEERHPIIELE